MEYGLTQNAIGSQKFVHITMKEYEDIKRSRDLLLEGIFIEQKFDLFIDNYMEFETEILEISVKEMIHSYNSWSTLQDWRNQINRRVVNLLSSARLYLDHMRHHVGRLEDSVPGIKSSLEKSTSTQYDTSLGYRFMEALRNYVQHRGYPIHSVTYRAERRNQGDAFSVIPYVEITQIEADGKFKVSVLKELKSIDGKIDIRPFVREYVGCIGKIQKTIRDHLQGPTAHSDALIRSAIQRYRNCTPIEENIVGLIAATCSNNLFNETVPLTTELLDYRTALEKKTGNLTYLAKQYVTGEAIHVHNR